MIGFDRPLRPRWIYDSLMLAQPGQNLSQLNQPFEEIARELTGKEGKRKARTVLFRCFLRDSENQTRVQERLVLKELSEEYGLEFMTPIYLFYLIASTDTLRDISEHIFRIYHFGDEVNVFFLKKKMVEAKGDRDVVSRATGAFLKTLNYFSVADEQDNILILKKRLDVSELQMALMLKLWATEIINAPQISTESLPASVFNWFHMPDIRKAAQKYNGVYWDYQHRMNGDLLTIFR